MRNRFAIAAAAIPLVATIAFAQTPAAGPSPPTVKVEVPSLGEPSWYHRQPVEWRASKLVGTTVHNSAGEKVGEINEILLSSDGSAAAAIIGVGGFLGIGEHEVAVDFKSLGVKRESDGRIAVTLNATRDSLKAAPAWTWQSS